ncbi:MAG TPA: universal stress protein [Kofleriaceae bacterium]|nr:universal stress protein [Kofleriaceae bacterium]
MTAKILCPTDFSPASQHAVRVAARLAREAKADLELLHVWHLPALAFAGEYPIPGDALDRMVGDARKELARAVREATELLGRPVTSQFLDGAPWERTCDTIAADPKIDLVVMGTHGRTGFRRIMLGSVAGQVVRHARCSVLTVRGREGTQPYRRILCPVDFSASARRAAELAATLADPKGLGLTLLHAVQLPVFPMDPTMPAYVAEVEEEAHATLEAWAAELRAKTSLPVEARTVLGSASAQAIALLDAELTYDLVAVGSHGRTGLGRVLLGSVAEQLVRHAPCSVLVARAATAG